MVTLDQLRKIVPYAGPRAGVFLGPLNDAMAEFEINTRLREAAFIAQIAHESGSFRYVRELASGAAYDTGRLAARLGNTPGADGDGERYKGRGLLQITGHDNYRDCGLALGLDLLAHPELLEQPVNAARSAGWFWHKHDLNCFADSGMFEAITRIINGGLNGIAEREEFYSRALEVLK